MNLKIVCPTRGLIHSRTLQSLKDNDIDLNDLIIGSGDLPHIQNELTREALKSAPSHVLFIEDDMTFPHKFLERMLKTMGAIVAIEYPLDNGYSTVFRHNEEIMWCGLGCTLVNAKVLREIGDPYFTSDHSYKLTEEPFTLEKIDTPNKYGGHDINFCMRARELGYEIKMLPGFEADHLRTDALNRVQTNKGAHNVWELEPIKIRKVF